jgi:uncharacterized protein (TIGR02118 family)
VIRVIGFYRWKEGAAFDHEYYCSTHMKLTRELLQPLGLIRLESDRYLSPKPPREGDVIAASNAYFETPEAAQAAMASAGAQLMSDVPKYTNLAPEIRMAVVTSHCE